LAAGPVNEAVNKKGQQNPNLVRAPTLIAAVAAVMKEDRGLTIQELVQGNCASRDTINKIQYVSIVQYVFVFPTQYALILGLRLPNRFRLFIE